VKGFANQMAEAKVGWVMFGLDDAYFAWPCSPNSKFDYYTGYGPGQKCSNRDLIMDVANALHAKRIKLIIYYAGLNGYMKEPKVLTGLKDKVRGKYNDKTPPSAESRKLRLAILKEYADRYKDKIAGWWFDVMEPDTYNDKSNDWWTVNSIVHNANPKAVISFSHGGNEFGCVKPGIDDYTAGDTWNKQDLTKLIPANYPAEKGILWHGKIYCGNVYHGQGDANQFSDQELISWIKTCNRQGGVCTLDWPFDPKTGLIKDFGIKQMIKIGNAVKMN
jgi:Alpha-L-fucosidase